MTSKTSYGTFFSRPAPFSPRSSCRRRRAHSSTWEPSPGSAPVHGAWRGVRLSLVSTARRSLGVWASIERTSNGCEPKGWSELALPLEGIRILDLTWIVAGPLAGRLLADFGAEVIKVESATKVDGARWNGVQLFGRLPGNANRDPNAGGYFQDVSGGKLSCTLNLGIEQGRELLRRLVRASDAIICNLGGDQLARWGIDYEGARELNPRIIVLNMPTMESAGPRARWSAFGDEFAAAGGLKSVSGHPGELPLLFGHHYPDFGPNPFHGAIALVAALHHRERTGERQFIELSQYESTMSVLG